MGETAQQGIVGFQKVESSCELGMDKN